MNAVRHILYKLDLGGTLSKEAVVVEKRLRAVDEAASKTSKSTKGMGDVFKSAASKVGGSTAALTEFGSVLKDVAGGIGGTLGVVAGWAAGIGLAVGATAALTRATKQWLDGAIEANKRLKEAGLATAEQTAAIDDYAASSKRLDQALDQVSVSAASLVAGPFADMLDTLGGLLGIVPAVASAFDRLRDSFPGQAAATGLRGMLAAATLGASEALRFGINLGSDFWGSVGGTTDTAGPANGGIPASLLETPKTPGRVYTAGPDTSGLLGGNSPMIAPAPRGPAKPNYAAAIANNPVSTAGTSIVDVMHLTRQQFDALNQVASVSVQSLTTWDDSVVANTETIDANTAAQDPKKKVSGLGVLQGAAAVSSIDFDKPMLGAIGSMFGPVGGAIGTLADNFRELPSIMTGLGDQIVGVFTDLPGVMIELIPMVVTEVIPAIIQGLAEGVVEAIKDLFKGPSYQESLTQEFVSQGASRKEARDRAYQTALVQNQAAYGFGQGKAITDMQFPSYDVGTDYVERDQIAKIHKGEAVLTAAENRQRMRGGSGHNITINVYESQDVRRTTEHVRRALGSYGLGLSIDPLV